MAQSNEQLLQVVLRARDELTAVAQKAAKALEGTGEAAKKIQPGARGAAGAVGELSQVLQGLPGIGGQVISTLANILSKMTLLRTAGAGVVAGLAAASGAAVVLANRAGELGDELGDLSKLTGVSVRDLSALKVAAHFADIGLAELGQGLHFMALNLGKAQKEGSEARNVLLAMGFSGAEIKKGMEEPAAFMVLFAQRLQQLGTEADRTTARSALFGRSSRQLAELLDELAEKSLPGVISQAERLNGLWSQKEAEEASAYKREIQELKQQFSGLGDQIGRWVVPNLLDFLSIIRSGERWQPPEAPAPKPPDEGKPPIDLQTRLAEIEKAEEAAKKAAKDADDRAKRTKDAIDNITASLTQQGVAIEAQIRKLLDGETASVAYASEMQAAATDADLLNQKITIPEATRKSWDEMRQKILQLGQELRQATFEEGPLKSATQAMYEQVNSAAAAVIAFKDGSDAAARYAHNAKILALELEAMQAGVVIPPEAIDKIDAYFKRVQELAREERTLNFGERFKDLSGQISAVFMTDREREIASIRAWGDSLRVEIEKAIQEVPAFATGLQALLDQIPGAMERQVIETGVVFTSLKGLASGAFEGIIDSMTGAIEQGKSLNEVFRNMGNSILLGLNRALLKAAFAPLEEALSNVFRNLARQLGEGKDGGVMGMVAKLLIGIFSSAVGGAAGGAITPSSGGAESALGFDSSLGGPITASPDIAGFAKGGVVRGGFTPLSALRFRLSRQVQAYARGGIMPGAFRPLSGFSEPEPASSPAQLLHVLHTVTGLPAHAYASGGLLPGSFHPLQTAQLLRVMHGFTGLPARAYASGGLLPGRFHPLQTAQLLHVLHGFTGLPAHAFASGGVANQPMFGLIGEGQFNEAVVPLPDNRSIPVKFQGGAPTQQPPAPSFRVEILGDVIPKQPGMSKQDVIRIVVDDMIHDGPTRRAVQKHGGA